MIELDNRTPAVLVQSSTGHAWARAATVQEAVDRFLGVGGKPGFKTLAMAVDEAAHLDTNGRPVVRQRGPVWELEVHPTGSFSYVRKLTS